jgi:hypothetical protein
MTEVELFCTHCGAKLEPSSKFCTSCGRATPLAAAQAAAAPTPKSRPTGVTIVAILSILAGIGEFILAAIGGAIGVILIPIGIVFFVVAYGLLKGRPWGRTITIIISIITIILNVITIPIFSILSIISIILEAIILYYLNRPHIKAYFGKTVSGSG